MQRFLPAVLLWLLSFVCYDAGAQYNKSYFFWASREFLMDDRYEAAIETLNILLKVDPGAHEAYFLRGIAKYNLDDLLGAEADFTKAVEINPVYTMAYHYRAITRSRLGNYDDSLKDFQEAIELRPDLPGPYFSRGVTLLLDQQFERSIEDFDRFIRYENKVADAYINRGIAYLYLEDTIRARREFDTAIRTNREDPNGYTRRGMLSMSERRYEEALADFNMSIQCDSAYLLAYFNRALCLNDMQRPMEALADLDRVLELDPHNSLTYFNRAILRTHIGDYNRAVDDYLMVMNYNPDNVLVHYNLALLYGHLGYFDLAIESYSRAIELYPDFANAYLGRSRLRSLLRDERGAAADRRIAEQKIEYYRNNVTEDQFSVYADTSANFNRLIALDGSFSRSNFGAAESREPVSMCGSYRFILRGDNGPGTVGPQRYYVRELATFLGEVGNGRISLTTADTDLPADSIMAADERVEAAMNSGLNDWTVLFERAVTQFQIKQYTNALNYLNAAIDRNPSNALLYLFRSAVRSEMIDFISSIDNNYQRISIDPDPANSLRGTSSRVYSYDECISDLNKAVRLMPELAYSYYNRANLFAQSERLPEAYDDYTRAIELNPGFAEAYFNRGLVQIYMKDTRTGVLDLSKAGELGITEAYPILRRYSSSELTRR